MDYAVGLTVVILKVAFGLGFVIFVHELGHFLLAKLCGVKCEKFYLGFDIAGLRFFRFRWGETEYGVGIVPLGGYVKMLGQEDNPARMQAEIERARMAGETSDQNQQASPPVFDPRSFLAKSVPQRMAIISAGVVMNVIFAFFMAVVAFRLGVRQTPCIVGEVFPGEAAWQAGIRPGDEILEVAGKKMKQFRDLQTAISLGDIDPVKGVPLLIRRPGVSDPLTIVVKPDRSRGAFVIGVSGPKTTRLVSDRKTWLIRKRLAVLPGSAAEKASPPFQNGDRIVSIDDQPISDYSQIDALLAQKPEQTLTVVVERPGKDAQGQPTSPPQRLTISVPPQPTRQLGIIMTMGKITAVRSGSPAVAAGLMPGDIIIKPGGDPLTLPERLRRMVNGPVELTIQRPTRDTPIVTSVQLEPPQTISAPEIINSPVDVPALGATYEVLNRIAGVVEGSAAADAGLRPGDLLVRAKLVPPDGETLRRLGISPHDDLVKYSTAVVEFTDTQRNWPAFMALLQKTLPGTSVELTFSRQGQEQTVRLEPSEAKDWFNPDRGWLFELMQFERKATSLGEAVMLGGQETLEDLTIVFRTVGKLGTRQISPRLLSGPLMIVKMALQFADEGTAKLLLFLTLLSANLAVLNFLPIPLLDGGHFLLLVYEGIRGRPADERVQVALTYLGLIFIIILMIWVFGLDFGLISRR